MIRLPERSLVEVVRGPIAGVCGEVLRQYDGQIFLAVKLISQTAVVSIPSADIIEIHKEAPAQSRSLFRAMTFLLPREVRSPALDHMLDEREQRLAEGYTRTFVELMTVSQCLGLLVYFGWSFLWDVLNPFKSRRV